MSHALTLLVIISAAQWSARRAGVSREIGDDLVKIGSFDRN
jgi:hypothetical protein